MPCDMPAPWRPIHVCLCPVYHARDSFILNSSFTELADSMYLVQLVMKNCEGVLRSKTAFTKFITTVAQGSKLTWWVDDAKWTCRELKDAEGLLQQVQEAAADPDTVVEVVSFGNHDVKFE